jgi:hypothetical protein
MTIKGRGPGIRGRERKGEAGGLAPEAPTARPVDPWESQRDHPYGDVSWSTFTEVTRVRFGTDSVRQSS